MKRPRRPARLEIDAMQELDRITSLSAFNAKFLPHLGKTPARSRQERARELGATLAASIANGLDTALRQALRQNGAKA